MRPNSSTTFTISAALSALVAALACAPMAGAQASRTPATPATRASVDARPIALAEAIQLAQRNAPAAIQARGQVRTAHASRRAAYAAFIPSATVSMSTARQLPAVARNDPISGLPLSNDPWAQGQRFNANVDLFNGRRFQDLRATRAQIDAADAGEVAGQYQVRLDVSEQYYASLAARESEEAAQAQLAQAEQQLRVAVAKVQARTATRSDSLRARIQVGQGQLALLAAQNQRIAADAALTRLVATPFRVTASVPAVPDSAATGLASTTLPDSADLALLAERGPAVLQARANATAARALSRAARAPYLPTLSMGYSHNATGTTGQFAVLPDDPRRTGQLSFSLSYPLFNQYAREEGVTRADIAEDNAEATLRNARLAAQEQLVVALGTLRLATQQSEIQAATVVASDEDLRVQQQRYELGAATLLDVLTSQTQLTNARTALIQARLDTRLARARLEALIGRDLGTTTP